MSSLDRYWAKRDPLWPVIAGKNWKRRRIYRRQWREKYGPDAKVYFPYQMSETAW